MTLTSADAPPLSPQKRRGTVSRLFRSALRTTRGKVGLTLTLLVVVIAFGGPLAAKSPGTGFVSSPFAPAGHGAGFLGADNLGRNVVDRVLNGGHQLLLVSAISTAVAVFVGAVAGVVAAYLQGLRGTAIMRLVDVLLAMPQLVFVLFVVSVLGAHTWLLVLAVSTAQAPQVARVVYAAAQDVCERDFVKAVALWGVPARVVLWRQVLPSLSTPLAVEAGLRLSFSIILISGLNFLGIGAQPPNPSWGVMVNENRLGLGLNPWGVLAPALILGVLAVGTNLFADSLARGHLGEDRGDLAVLASTLTAPEAAA